MGNFNKTFRGVSNVEIFHNKIMKFLEYTKKLYEKMTYYDNIINRSNMSNPFAKSINLVTVIWIENKEDD